MSSGVTSLSLPRALKVSGTLFLPCSQSLFSGKPGKPHLHKAINENEIYLVTPLKVFVFASVSVGFFVCLFSSCRCYCFVLFGFVLHIHKEISRKSRDKVPTGILLANLVKMAFGEMRAGSLLNPLKSHSVSTLTLPLKLPQYAVTTNPTC